MTSPLSCESDSAAARPSIPWWRSLGVSGVSRRLSRFSQLRRERNQLQALPDELLRDVGLTREQARRESRRPYWDDIGWRR